MKTQTSFFHFFKPCFVRPALGGVNSASIILCAALLALLSACSSNNEGALTSAPATASAAGFSLRSQPTNLDLREGDSAGLDIPLNLTRTNGHTAQVNLSIAGISAQDSAFVSTAFSSNSLTTSSNQANVNLRLEIGVLPLPEQQRTFIISASDGVEVDQLTITVNVRPVERDDVYLLIGQSNMVGFGGDGTKQAWPGGEDEANNRIKQFNVTKNGEDDVFLSAADYTDVNKNFRAPLITNAIDPLHIPVDEFTLNKAENYVGMGLTFAKTALPSTSRNIILVPAAWSGTSFCNTSTAPAHWNGRPTDAPHHGNTLLFDRALTRINHALTESGGILRGILWHQGESDSNEECSLQYGYNLMTMITEFRSRIVADARGVAARGPQANIPFVAGTMSRGIDERDDLSQFPPEKQVVDNVHRNIASLVPYAEVSNLDDLTPANGYPCGNTSCIHFGSRALREMGRRYHAALVRASQP